MAYLGKCKDIILKHATTRAYYVVSNSSFTNHPTIIYNLSSQK